MRLNGTRLNPCVNMLHYITEIVSVEPYEVVCRFNGGELRRVDMRPLLEKYADVKTGPLAELRKPEAFRRVTLDSYGTLSWEGEVDFCPDVLWGMSVAA